MPVVEGNQQQIAASDFHSVSVSLRTTVHQSWYNKRRLIFCNDKTDCSRVGVGLSVLLCRDPPHFSLLIHFVPLALVFFHDQNFTHGLSVVFVFVVYGFRAESCDH